MSLRLMPCQINKSQTATLGRSGSGLKHVVGEEWKNAWDVKGHSDVMETKDSQCVWSTSSESNATEAGRQGWSGSCTSQEELHSNSSESPWECRLQLKL